MRGARPSSEVSDEAARGRHTLDPIFLPRSVAVIGASADPRKRGNRVLEALRTSGFEGDVYPVNPKGGEIHGLHVFESIATLPEAVDLALICLPAAAVPDASYTPCMRHMPPSPSAC